jgi:GT2 family glycosyltransferase
MTAFNPLDHSICFAYPLRLATSAWTGHVPFAMYLVDILRPKVVVELGTHNGVSYCSFCQAVRELKLETRCYAIDTWQGDEHSGFYGPEVLAELKEHHDPLYGGFSRLIQSTFDEAVAHFENKSIDLLHIDGYHTFEAVKHDFETWLPKISERGIVLLHDINVREGKFGVWKFWKTLRSQYPHFEFVHSHGLGLAAVGKQSAELLRELLNTSIEDQAQIREMFYQLGLRLEVTHELQILKHTRLEQSEASIKLSASMQDQDLRTEISNLHSVYEKQLVQLTSENNKAQAVYVTKIRHQADKFSEERSVYEAQLARQSAELSELPGAYERQINLQKDALTEARAGYEAQLRRQTDEFSQARSTLEELLARQAKELSDLVNGLSDLRSALSASQQEHHQAADLNESLRTQLAESEKVIHARGDEIALLQDELAESREKHRLLSAQLSSKTQEVERITGSLGWQWLSRYGRLKYRYLLPVSRMLGLPSSVTAGGDNLASQSPLNHQTAPMTKPQIDQNGQTAWEPLEQAIGREERRYALESNSSDVVIDRLEEQADQPTTVDEQQKDIQSPLTQQAEELAAMRRRLLVLQTQLHQRDDALAQARAQVLAAETEIRYRRLSDTNTQITKRANLPSSISELSEKMEEAIAEFQKRMAVDPSILDWNSGLELAVSFPHLAVFSPLLSEGIDPTLPYLDHSIDIVVTSSSAPAQIAEARRVAGIAVIRLRSFQFDKLEHLTSRKLGKSLVSLEIDWLTDQVNEPALPMTSIIIPVYNKVSYTQSCLEQLSATLPDDFDGEIIIVDDASSDETPALLEHWAAMEGRIKILRNPEQIGLGMSYNRGAEAAQGEILIFLNNDTLPLPGWLPPLVRVLRDHPEAGAVGGKLVYPDGTLQEAGGVVFSDGSVCNFGKFDKAPNAPLYNFMREVDYCSGAILATSRALFMELGGFDARFKPAYYEDVDYCFSLRERGYRVYYQPESVVVHFEETSSGTDLNTDAKSCQAANHLKFLAKWREVLRHHYPAPEQYNPSTLHTLSRRNVSANGHGN